MQEVLEQRGCVEGDVLSSPMQTGEGSKAFLSFRIWHVPPSMPVALGWHFQFLGVRREGENSQDQEM